MIQKLYPLKKIIEMVNIYFNDVKYITGTWGGGGVKARLLNISRGLQNYPFPFYLKAIFIAKKMSIFSEFLSNYFCDPCNLNKTADIFSCIAVSLPLYLSKFFNKILRTPYKLLAYLQGYAYPRLRIADLCRWFK
jgi:hypothetical protein